MNIKKKLYVLKLVCVCVSFILCFSTVAYGATVKHNTSPYTTYAQNKLKVTGDGVGTERVYTVADLEALTEGGFSAVYTMRTLVEGHNGKFEGVTIDSLLKKSGVKSTAKSVNVVCADGVSLIFDIKELTSTDYVNEVDQTKLKAILAFAKDGKPLVPETTSAGYNKASQNNGGPLRLMIGQTQKGERNSPKCLQNVVKIEVSTKAAKTRFTDIGSFYSWTSESINYLADVKAITVPDNGKYYPEREMTRAEFVKILISALGTAPQKVTKSSFKDVSTTDWYSPYVEAAATKKILDVPTGGNFNPNGKITRNEAAIIAVKAMGNKARKASAISYKDKDKIPSSTRTSVASAEAMKLFDNIAVGYFNGHLPLNRAEGAVVIYRTVKSIS